MAPKACPVCKNRFCPGPKGVAQDPNLCNICHLLGSTVTGGICAICAKATKTDIERSRALLAVVNAQLDAITWKTPAHYLPGGIIPHYTNVPPKDPEKVDLPRPEMPPARLEGERVVFREWNIGEGLELFSTNASVEWKREMVARCNTLVQQEPDGSNHLPPVERCGCGLYAFYEPPNGTRYSSGGIPGAIVVSSKVLLGPTGVRAEKARIVLLGYKDERQRVLAQGAAAKLGVGCCALEDLKHMALEFGSLVPEEERPETAKTSDYPYASGVVPPGTYMIPSNAHGSTASGGIAIRGNTIATPSSGGINISNWRVDDKGAHGGQIMVNGKPWGPAKPTYTWAWINMAVAALNLGLGLTGAPILLIFAALNLACALWSFSEK